MTENNSFQNRKKPSGREKNESESGQKPRKSRKKRLKKSQKWAIFVLVVALFCGWFIWQQESIVTDTYTISSGKLPAAFEGLRIVHLSDVHGKEFGADSARLLEAVAALEPDIIAVTGDLIDDEAQLEMVPALARGLSAIAPTYYVTGNHEWAVRRVNDLKALLEENGVTVLTNEYVLLEREGASIVLAGLDDPNGPADQKTGAQLRAEIAADVGGDVYTVLLSHRDTVEDYAAWGYDLVLCGHGHGGIFRIPIIDKGLLSTDRTFFPEYDGGAYQIGSAGWCVVSRGLGSNTVPIHAFRLFNRPHLPLVVLTGGV